MQILKYYTTQTDLANALKFIVDEYLNNNISEDKMAENIIDLINSNPDKYYKGKENNPEEINSKVRIVLGKRRLSLINNVLRQVRG